MTLKYYIETQWNRAILFDMEFQHNWIETDLEGQRAMNQSHRCVGHAHCTAFIVPNGNIKNAL